MNAFPNAEDDVNHQFLLQQVALDDLYMQFNVNPQPIPFVEPNDADQIEEEDEIVLPPMPQMQQHPIPLLLHQHVVELLNVHDDQGHNGLDQPHINLPGDEPHVAENMPGFAAPGQLMQAHQGEVELELFIEDAVPGELDGIFHVWPEPHLLHPQNFPNGNWPGGDFFANVEDEIVENQLDVDMGEWAEGNEDEREMIMWTNFGLL